MSKSLIIGAVALLAVLVPLMWLLGSYNGLVAMDEQVQTSWSEVEVQYQRRFDLVPNLVEATKGVLAQEQEVFGAIAEARTRYASAEKGSNESVEATAQYESALARLLVVMENYPQLKSVESVRALTDELAGTENRVAVARGRYNTNVGEWNTYVRAFPKNVIAGIFGFEKRVRFEADEPASAAPKVDLKL